MLNNNSNSDGTPNSNPAEIYLENKSKKQYPKEIKVTRYFEEIVIS